MSKATKIIRVWWRSNAEPCVLQRDKWPRVDDGEVYDVTGARSRREAEALVQRFRQPEPDRRADPQGWLAWIESRDQVEAVERLDADEER